MSLCARVIPQSSLEINKIGINDKTLQLPIPNKKYKSTNDLIH